jgi:hypothetical protein
MSQALLAATVDLAAMEQAVPQSEARAVPVATAELLRKPSRRQLILRTSTLSHSLK